MSSRRDFLKVSSLVGIGATVPAFLARLNVSDRVGCAPQAKQTNKRASWPGNEEQLLQVKKRDVSRHQSGLIQPD